MSTANLIILLINLFDPHPLPMKQAIKVANRNISTPKSGVQDLVVTHYDCAPQHSTILQ